MNRDRAEAYLRLLAEAELRRAVAWRSDGPEGSRPAATWIETITTGQSAQVRARLPLRWE